MFISFPEELHFPPPIALLFLWNGSVNDGLSLCFPSYLRASVDGWTLVAVRGMALEGTYKAVSTCKILMRLLLLLF